MKKKILSKNDPHVWVEHCANPWNGKCESTDIQLYIYYKSEQLPICSSCWVEIADADIEWGGGYALS